MTPSVDVAIIGAGVAGLAAARTLRKEGRSVMVIDKGRGVGGRLATRRIGDARLDHGAQFFTVRGERFAEVVDAAKAAGAAKVWCHGFDSTDGYPRYMSPRGMTTLAKWMATQLSEDGVEMALARRVTTLVDDNEFWSLHDDSGPICSARDLIITAPVPQTLDLFDASALPIDTDIATELRSITYKPVLALLMTIEGEHGVPSPGAIQATEADTFTFIADNLAKGVSDVPALTFHTNKLISAQRWDDDEHSVTADLLHAAAPWVANATVLEVQLKKWKFAGPVQPHPDTSFRALTSNGKTVMLAGDAFGGPKVEGAFNSGEAAANEILGAAL